MKNRRRQQSIDRSLAVRVAGAALALLLAVAAAGAAELPGLAAKRLDETAARYEAAAWPTGPARAGLPLMAIAAEGYAGGPAELLPGPLALRRFADDEGAERLLVEVSVRETAAEARTVLLEYLASANSPAPVPRLASLDIPVGDIGFVGRAPGKRIAWIAFLRGNVAVRLVCLDPQADPHPEMAAIAAGIDRLVLEQPLPAEAGPGSRIAVTALTCGRQHCVAGDVVPLRVGLNAEPAAVRWVVGGPGQGYVERDARGVWQLHTTKDGSIDLECRVLGPNGFTDSASVILAVAAE